LSVEIREATTSSEVEEWVRFVYSHYRDHPCWVPPMLSDEIDYMDADENPAFQVSKVRMLGAWSGGEMVGRVAGIIADMEEAKHGRRIGRFGWFESVDDPEVAHGLLSAVQHWLDANRCVAMQGPMGFTDLDPTGLLVEGFDLIPTVAGSYHYPYYARLIESFGLEKDVDYLEFRMDVSRPARFLERLRGRLGDLGYEVVTPASRRALMREADAFWACLEEVYEHLYGVIPLTDAQKTFYTEKYLSFLDPEFVKLGYAADGELIGFFVGMPNMSRAFQKARGRLLPLGWLHILRAYRWPRTVDFLMAGVKSGEATDLLTAAGLLDMYDTLRRRGIRYLETNRELESNTKVNRLWRKFDVIATRRSRVYRMELRP